MSTLISAIILDLIYTSPYWEFSLFTPNNFLLILLFISIPFINTIFTSRFRRQEEQSRRREHVTNTMLKLSKNLSFVSGNIEVQKVAVQTIKEGFGFNCAFMLKNKNGVLSKEESEYSTLSLTPEEREIAEWVFATRRAAGRSTDTFMAEEKSFYPLNSLRMSLGVIIIKMGHPFNADEELLWITLKRQISNALEREYLNEIANQSLLLQESEKLYKTLFNSISHELRIPVTSIISAAETMRTLETGLKQELSEEIYMAAQRLSKLIEDLLNMSRVDSGRISPRLDWYDVHDLISSVVKQLKEPLTEYHLAIYIDEDMPLVRIDIVLLEQILYNLLYNVIVYVPKGRNVEVSARHDGHNFVLSVTDNGNGFSEKDLPHIFDKFYRGNSSITGGSGLGLSIVKGYTDVLKGRVTAKNMPEGGARITISLPSEIPTIENLNNNDVI